MRARAVLCAAVAPHVGRQPARVLQGTMQRTPAVAGAASQPRVAARSLHLVSHGPPAADRARARARTPGNHAAEVLLGPGSPACGLRQSAVAPHACIQPAGCHAAHPSGRWQLPASRATLRARCICPQWPPGHDRASARARTAWKPLRRGSVGPWQPALKLCRCSLGHNPVFCNHRCYFPFKGQPTCELRLPSALQWHLTPCIHACTRVLQGAMPAHPSRSLAQPGSRTTLRARCILSHMAPRAADRARARARTPGNHAAEVLWGPGSRHAGPTQPSTSLQRTSRLGIRACPCAAGCHAACSTAVAGAARQVAWQQGALRARCILSDTWPPEPLTERARERAHLETMRQRCCGALAAGMRAPHNPPHRCSAPQAGIRACPCAAG